MRGQPEAPQLPGTCPDAVGGERARLRLSETTAKTTTKTV